jgi:DNA-binding CsgD family transcriptional regulator
MNEDNRVLNTKTQTKPEPPTLVTLPPLVSKAGPSNVSSNVPSCDVRSFDRLAMMFETFLDQLFPFQGFLLLDSRGKLVHRSPKAEQFCVELHLNAVETHHRQPWSSEGLNLPAEIKILTQHLVESRQLFTDLYIQLEDVVVVNETTRLQLQARWVTLSAHAAPYIVVMIENLTDAVHQQALFDARQYQFTQREAEVWELHLQGLTYRQMGEQLYISVNTVKRHMKSIHSKRRDEYLDWASSA